MSWTHRKTAGSGCSRYALNLELGLITRLPLPRYGQAGRYNRAPPISTNRPMNTFRFAALILILTLGVGCNRDPAPAPLAESKPLPALPAAPATSTLQSVTEIFSKVAPGKGTPVPVLADQTFSGKYVMDRDGALSAFGIRIGTYHGKADGSLKLKLCADAACQEAELPLAGAKDNDYLVFQLPEAMPITSGATLDYTLTRSSNDPANRVAIWVYPKRADQPGVVDPTGKAIEAVGRLSIHLQ